MCQLLPRLLKAKLLGVDWEQTSFEGMGYQEVTKWRVPGPGTRPWGHSFLISPALLFLLKQFSFTLICLNQLTSINEFWSLLIELRLASIVSKFSGYCSLATASLEEGSPITAEAPGTQAPH